jgi:hypothetical protein
MELDLLADLKAQDDDGNGWSLLTDAREPARVRTRRGASGRQPLRAVVRVLAVDEDGQVHFMILPGSVEKNRHLLDRTVA